MDVPMWRRCTPHLPRHGGVEAIKRGLSETVVYAAEVDYNQTVVHKTARQRYYCHLNGLAPARRESPPSRGRRDAGETWKLNARDRSVIIQDEGGKGTIVGDWSRNREKSFSLPPTASDDVAGSSDRGS